MSSNSELLQKADLAIADFTGGSKGGLLNPEQGSAFIRKLILEPTILRTARVVEMTADTRNINKIQFGKRILRAATQGTALADVAVDSLVFDPSTGNEATARAKPHTEQIQLVTKEVIAEIRIPYDVMEDNIERATVASNENMNTGPGGLRDTILTLIAERAALDLEELGLLGDTDIGASADPYLRLTDGFIKRIEGGGNISDAAGATVSKAIFKAGVKVMPDQYLRNRSALNHYVSVDNETEYRDTIADRATGLGDSAVTGFNPLFAFGSPVIAAPLMPEGKGLYTNPLNLIMGIQRAVSLEFDKSITERVYIIVLTARVDFQVEETEAGVAYNNIGS